MTQYKFYRLVQRRGTDSAKWDYMHRFDARAGAEHLPFWVADMDFPCAEPIVNALQSCAARQIYGYGSTDEGFFAEIAAWYQRRFAWQLEPDTLFYSPGIVTGISLLLEAISQPGDGVIIQTPVYYPFANLVRAAGRQVVANPLINEGDGRYRMDYEDLERQVRQNKFLILCSPHNPVGRVWQAEELRRLVEICLANGVTIIADEIHHDLLRRGITHQVLAQLCPEARESIITTISPSKTFNLAGLQYSNLVIYNQRDQARWRRLVEQQYSLHEPNVFSVAAVRAAYQAGEEWLEQVVDYLDGNFAFMQSFLAQELPQCVFRIPEGTYLAWLDLRAYGLDEALYGRLITEGKVLVEQGTIFGEEGAGFIRLNAACPRPMLQQGLENLAQVLQSTKTGGKQLEKI